MALVSSSTNSGTPSVRVRICSSSGPGSALPPASTATIAALCVRVSLDRFSAPTWPWPDQREANSGWWVSTTSSGTAFTRSISRSSTSRVVGISPVRILEQQHAGLPASGRFGDIDQGPQRLVLLPLRRHGQRAVALLARDGQDRGDEPDVGQRAAILRHDQSLKLVKLRLGCLVAPELQCPLEVVDDRPEGAVHIVGRALEAQRLHALGLEPLAQHAQSAALADAGLAAQQHHLTIAVPRLGPAAQQQIHLLVAA